MSSAAAYDDETIGSVARENLAGVISGPGTYLSTLDYSKHKLLVCTETGDDFIIDHVYLCDADGTGVIDITVSLPHTHTSSSDGGELFHIYRTSVQWIDLLLVKTSDLLKAHWREQVSGTGSIEDDIDGTTGERSIRLRPNATSGSGASVRYRGLRQSFAYPSVFTTKLQIETGTSIALHSGPEADLATDADSNDEKYNAEVCTATNNNWFLRSANGTTNSTSDTGTAFSTSKVGLKMIHRPDLGTPEVSLKIDAGSVFQKTTHVPISGDGGNNTLITHSVKNSTAADRPLKMFGCRLTYRTTNTWGQD